MNTKKVIEIYNKVFFELKNLWEISEKWTKAHSILDNFLDELNMKKTPENRYIAYSRITELRVEPLELFIEKMKEKIKNSLIWKSPLTPLFKGGEDSSSQIWKSPLTPLFKGGEDSSSQTQLSGEIKIPNKFDNKQEVLNKAYNYVARIYTDLQEKFIYELEKKYPPLKRGDRGDFVSDFELAIFKWVLNVWKAFNKFNLVWENHIKKQNEILDKRFNSDSEKIINFLREKNLLETDENWNETDRSYSVLKWGKIISYFEAFWAEVNSIIVALQDFIEDLSSFLTSSQEEEQEKIENYIEYLKAIKEAFLEKDCKKLLSRWQKVDEKWMAIKGPMQISHPLEFYEDKYRKAVAPEWDLRILDTKTLTSKVKKNISVMYEEIYKTMPSSQPSPLGKKEQEQFDARKFYNESYSFSKDNFNRVQLYVSEPVLYFWSELNWIFSAQVVPNDEIVSEKYWKKIFAFPKMVLESKKKAPLLKITKEVLDEKLLKAYKNIIDNDKLFFEIYDIETIGHEFWHTLWLTKNTETLMNKKTWNFKNIEEFKATTWGLCSYFMNSSSQFSLLKEKGQEQKNSPLPQGRGAGGEVSDFDKNLIVMHLFRCIGLLKYREVAEVLPYYNESLIHLEIMFETWIFEIKNSKIVLNWSEENYEKLKKNYINHYKKLIKIYLDKNDAWEFLFDYVITDKNWNNISKTEILREFWEYYYNLYKKIGNKVV